MAIVLLVLVVLTQQQHVHADALEECSPTLTAPVFDSPGRSLGSACRVSAEHQSWMVAIAAAALPLTGDERACASQCQIPTPFLPCRAQWQPEKYQSPPGEEEEQEEAGEDSGAQH